MPSSVARVASAAASLAAVARSRVGAIDRRSSRTVVAGCSAVPTSWCITPSCPSMLIVPAVGVSSPVISRRSVVLPTPFAPTSATRSPLPIVKLMSSSSSSPLGSRHSRWLTEIAPIRSRPSDRAHQMALITAQGVRRPRLHVQSRCEPGFRAIRQRAQHRRTRP